ncbi:peptidoglycan DD-metalloendopeptidase family protein [Tessaracoccus rhinocerotis]|uniref:Peptidoglycan DD-metalloendopeptidase family protein n=1 Tax=Tessaracoccus rhinocerotis TaxID=1689449 RepID=A0A553K435_9ACTN|nr:M23 family metallopeptidase [Tessaracoccus rhinocerotis]TRY19446.1 peptidoglycan DD-metalloendopeptidase family protein [Tessaracoccus rhinocerotis]
MYRDLPPQPENPRTAPIRVVVAALVLALVVSMGALGASADQLDERREELKTEIAQAKSSVDGASAAVNDAIAALEAAEAELAAAEAALKEAEEATEKARTLDEQRAEELADAEHKVKQAEADVAAAQAAFDSVDARTTEELTVITQQSGPLVDFALLLTDVSMADLNHRAQLGETLLTSSALELDELQEQRFKLDAAKSAADDARAAAKDAREEAARQLADTEAKEDRAEQLRTDVEGKVAARDKARVAAQNELKAEQARQSELEAEAADVDRRIAERIAREEAARKAAEEKAAREAAAREAAAREAAARQSAAANKAAADKAAASRAAANRAAAQKAAAQKAATQKAAASSSTGFMLPVNGRLSSRYGMRLHPVLGYRKLHDGTDFAAACGTPIKAAAAGTVAERYYNAGYGNRLMIDHGRINGTYVTTGYNHATKYIVGVGQRVSKGQVIGYVGTTGYSTGCHLHLMVWQNGSVTNPMAKWFG